MKLLNEDKFDAIIKRAAEKFQHDWLLLKAQIKQESRFNHKAKSPAGARGLAQFMPRTWREWFDLTPGVQLQKLPKIKDVEDPEANIMAQGAYMRWLLGYVSNDIRTALAAYNAGPGTIKKLQAQHGRDFVMIKDYLPSETQNYVYKILQYYQEYKEEMNHAKVS